MLSLHGFSRHICNSPYFSKPEIQAIFAKFWQIVMQQLALCSGLPIEQVCVSLDCVVFRLARPLGILWLYSDTHKLPNVSDSVDIIQAEPQTTSPSEVSLAKGHWKLKSEVSKPSFFENNYGFSKRDILQVGPFAVPCTLANATCTHC